ncbi:hypothetical protein CALVIDRAFT_563806 [Calocera viscosa TUFC12733]|uniref:Homeobox domain-containing protein n=1 Tax=Calocera viscosa (strain TUFC12733) TaxID=1330018 RepID=A0A167MI62_CALVF|nr:hypothetical protein CALVIDRAFT_563806 [Calocera viscosa TUFC12733]
MNPNLSGYAKPSHKGDPRPSLQVSTNALPPGYPISAYSVDESQPGYHIAPPNPNDPNAYDPNSPSSISPTPASSTSALPADDNSPKRKRSRVTPEQLTRLEELFASDRSPTVSRRKEISAELGMRERQTQIWFQNRRAKAKVQEGKGKPRTKKSASHKSRKSGVTSPGSGGQDLSPEEDEEEEEDDFPGRPPPPEHPQYDRYVAHRFGESGPIHVIPCHVLKIGTWPTVSDPSKGRELVAFVAPRQTGAALVMVWFFSEGGKSYKLELPVAAIESTHVTSEVVRPSDPYAIATARLGLSRVPAFYVLTRPASGRASTPTASNSQNRALWTPCPDFTQGGTGASARIYEMQGPAQPMVQALRNFPNYSQDGSLSPSMTRPTLAPGPGTLPEMTVPMLPNLPHGGIGPYPSYHQGVSSQHLPYSSRSVSGPSAMMYSPQYLQQPPPAQQQASYPQPGNQPTFAFDVNTAIPPQGYPGPISSLSDPGAPQSAANYSGSSSRPFTAETLTTPFFPDLSSPVFQEAARSLMNDENDGQMYPPYTQQPQYSPSNSAAQVNPRILSTQPYPAQASYGQHYGTSAPTTAASTAPQEYPIQYGGPRSISQPIPLQPPGSSHGYPLHPPQSREGAMGYRRPANPQ